MHYGKKKTKKKSAKKPAKKPAIRMKKANSTKY